MTPKQLLALGGAAILFIGVFAPIASAPELGTMNFFLNGQGGGVVILILAVLAALAAVMKWNKLLWFSGLASLGWLGLTLVRFVSKVAEKSDNPPTGMTAADVRSFQLEWGWALLVIGAVAVVIAAAMKGPAKPVQSPSLPTATAVPAAVVSDQPSGSQTRPWIRYLAKMIDLLLFLLLSGMLLLLVWPDALNTDQAGWIFVIIFQFAYVFVEPIMVCSWGSTPGRSLLRVRLRRQDGNKLTFSEALKRAFKVWIKGLGLGIPIVALFTEINAYNRLKKEGLTSWDRDGQFRVTHQPVGAVRSIVAVIFFIGFLALMVVGGMENVGEDAHSPMAPTLANFQKVSDAVRVAGDRVTEREIQDARANDEAMKKLIKKTLVDTVDDAGFDLDATLKDFATRLRAGNYTQDEGVIVMGFIALYKDHVADLARWGFIHADTKDSVEHAITK